MGSNTSSRRRVSNGFKKKPIGPKVDNKSSKSNRYQDKPSEPSGTPPLHNDATQASVKGALGAVPARSETDFSLSADAAGPVGASVSRRLSRASSHHHRSSGAELATVSSYQVITHDGGFLTNASNLKIDRTTMVEVHGSLGGGIHQHYHDSNILKEMKSAYVTIEAEFDSSDREYAPRCHPGTRIRFLEELKGRIHSTTRIIWLFGPAGVGKSAIMQTLAETLSKPRADALLPSVICLSFFFSRPNGRNDPKKLFATLAYRLAIAHPEYRLYLEENLVADPDFLAKTLEEQFNRLFIDPVSTNRVTAFPRCVVFLDGLDEADGPPAQRRILDLIRGFCECDRAVNLHISWVIASRPEPHLQTFFFQTEANFPDLFWRLEIPIDSDEAAREVETYIRAAFLKIREDFSDILPAHWPPEADLLKVTTTSNGLFVFASTSMGYIGDENPVERLQHIVGLIDHYRAESRNARPNLSRNPFEILDRLYRTVLNNVPTDSLPTTRAFLGFYLLDEKDTGNPPLVVACQILGCDQFKARAALRGLQSVLRCPSRDDSQTPLKFLHASFSDFLRDRSRSGEHWFDMTQEIRRVWRCYVRVFRRLLESVYQEELVPLRNHECLDRLRGDALLMHHSSHNWLRILTTHCHALPCNCDVSYHLILEDTELVNIFREFSPALLCPEAKYTGVIIDGIVDWLYNTSEHAPHGLLEHLYRQTMTLDKLTEPIFECIFKRLSAGYSASWRYEAYAPDSLRKLKPASLCAAQWEKFRQEPVEVVRKGDRLLLQDGWRLLGDLMHLDKGHQIRSTVRIFGVRGNGLWVIISGEFAVVGSTSDYLIFPCADPSDNL